MISTGSTLDKKSGELSAENSQIQADIATAESSIPNGIGIDLTNLNDKNAQFVQGGVAPQGGADDDMEDPSYYTRHSADQISLASTPLEVGLKSISSEGDIAKLSKTAGRLGGGAAVLTAGIDIYNGWTDDDAHCSTEHWTREYGSLEDEKDPFKTTVTSGLDAALAFAGPVGTVISAVGTKNIYNEAVEQSNLTNQLHEKTVNAFKEGDYVTGAIGVTQSVARSFSEPASIAVGAVERRVVQVIDIFDSDTAQKIDKTFNNYANKLATDPEAVARGVKRGVKAVGSAVGSAVNTGVDYGKKAAKKVLPESTYNGLRNAYHGVRNFIGL